MNYIPLIIMAIIVIFILVTLPKALSAGEIWFGFPGYAVRRQEHPVMFFLIVASQVLGTGIFGFIIYLRLAS